MAKWVPAATLEELPEGRRKCVAAAGKSLVLFHLPGTGHMPGGASGGASGGTSGGGGGIHAIVNVCPHAGLPLEEGELTGSILVCPYHGYAFNIQNGKNVDYADDVPLEKLPIRVEAGVIHVDVEPPAAT